MNTISFLYDFFIGLETIDSWIAYNSYHQNPDQVSYWIGLLNSFTHVKFSEAQKKMILKLWIHLNVETIKHSFNCVLFGDFLIRKYTEKEFKRLTRTSKDNFLLGLAVHDSGKTLVPNIFLETDRMLINSERKLITNMHTKFAKQVIKKFVPNMPNEIIEIASKHHKQKVTKEILKFVQVIDITEALMSERCYKVAFEKNIVLSILRKNELDVKYVSMVEKHYKNLQEFQDFAKEVFEANIIVDYYSNYKNDILDKAHTYTDYFWKIAYYMKDFKVFVKLIKEEKD